MKETKTIVKNPEGINARSAALIAQCVEKYQSSVWLQKGDIIINAKSVLGIIALALAHDDEIIMKAIGKDEEQVLDKLKEML